MRVYLDNCCHNRPFDEQTQLKVRLETEAKLRVRAMMRDGEVEYVWSDVLSETVHSLAEKARETGEMLRDMDKVNA